MEALVRLPPNLSIPGTINKWFNFAKIFGCVLLFLIKSICEEKVVLGLYLISQKRKNMLLFGTAIVGVDYVSKQIFRKE